MCNDLLPKTVNKVTVMRYYDHNRGRARSKGDKVSPKQYDARSIKKIGRFVQDQDISILKHDDGECTGYPSVFKKLLQRLLDSNFGDSQTAEYLLRSSLELDETPLVALHTPQRFRSEVL